MSLSLNQKTINRATLAEAVDVCARHGVEAIGVWREPLADAGVARGAKLVRDAGLRVSSLCRGGFLTGDDAGAARDDNRRAIDEAVALGTDTLVLVVGGLPPGSRDLAGARERVATRLAELAPYAGAGGVRLALEPMHPLYCADRGVLSTLDQALDLASGFTAEQVAVVVDTFHVWWDPRVLPAIARAGDRIASYQVCDWITPLPPDALLARGLPGDGHIDFGVLGAAVAAAGYRGDIEVEIFNADVWAAPFDAVVTEVIRRFRAVVEPG
ncbi:sugar phosphate isomerase/epimerase family protein [Cryptosporangium arvum]|uniref:sugar phosphate isomerase/epimerase family protein n=1 Tax=Cryptosporangium arvum TaxID=80871 RepID=UPI0004BC0CAA|nr:sugar phosphate isomerase/epimerase family protein [Cryptosporangium arvum]